MGHGSPVRAPRYPVLGGAGAAEPYKLITTWGDLRDAGSFVASASKTDGTVTLAMAGDVTQVDGYQESYAGYDVLLTDLYPDWSDATDVLHLYCEIAAMPLTLAKYGLFCGVASGAYVDRASQSLVGAGVFPNTTAAVNVTQEGATANGTNTQNGTNTDVPIGMDLTIRWDAAGVPRLTYRVDKTESGLSTASITGTAVPAQATLAARRVVVGHKHVSTTSGTPVLSARVWYRRSRGAARASLPLPTRPAAPSVMCLFGHSIANGVGADDTVYGGAAVPATATILDAGVDLSTYPDNAGAGADPGVLPYWVAAYPNVTIIREASNGQILAGVETTQLPAALTRLAGLGLTPLDIDLVVLMIGENDAQNSTESAAYTSRIDQTCTLIERAFPYARILLQDMATQDAGSYGEFAAIRAANAAAVALAPARRALVGYTGITFADAVHYSLAGYATAGALQIAAWSALP